MLPSLLPLATAPTTDHRTMTTKEREQLSPTAPAQPAGEGLSHAEQNAEAWSDHITAAWEACDFCRERWEGRYLSTEAKAVLKEHGYDGTNHNAVSDLIQEGMQESALSVDIREGWRSPGERASMEPTEFQILLSTGGPALRIMGELDQWSQPARCWLEHQDWGTPWVRHFSRSAERAIALRWFASLFCFEG